MSTEFRRKSYKFPAFGYLFQFIGTNIFWLIKITQQFKMKNKGNFRSNKLIQFSIFNTLKRFYVQINFSLAMIYRRVQIEYPSIFSYPQQWPHTRWEA